MKKYEFDKHIGSGAFGLVREAFLINNPKERFAIKTVWKSSLPDLDFLRKEIEILMDLDNKYIVKCFEVYEDITCVHFVMELLKGGELFDFIINSSAGRLDPNISMSLFMQMIDAVHYIHAEGFMHRDIKPENFLIQTVEGKPEIKLIDFGFAVDFKQGQKLTDKVGSINYVAPEMMIDEGEYDQKVDIWAIGICLYNMIAGKQPFSDDDMEILTEKIKYEPLHFSAHTAFSNVDHKIKKLLERILKKDPEDRLSTGEIIMTKWITEYTGSDDVETLKDDFNRKRNNTQLINILKTTKNIKIEFVELCMKNLDPVLTKAVYVR